MVTLTYDLGTDLDGMELFQWVVCCLNLGGLAGGKDGFCFFGTMLSASAFLLPLITLEWSEKHHLLKKKIKVVNNIGRGHGEGC